MAYSQQLEPPMICFFVNMIIYLSFHCSSIRSKAFVKWESHKDSKGKNGLPPLILAFGMQHSIGLNSDPTLCNRKILHWLPDPLKLSLIVIKTLVESYNSKNNEMSSSRKFLILTDLSSNYFWYTIHKRSLFFFFRN